MQQYFRSNEEKWILSRGSSVSYTSPRGILQVCLAPQSLPFCHKSQVGLCLILSSGWMLLQFPKTALLHPTPPFQLLLLISPVCPSSLLTDLSLKEFATTVPVMSGETNGGYTRGSMWNLNRLCLPTLIILVKKHGFGIQTNLSLNYSWARYISCITLGKSLNFSKP